MEFRGTGLIERASGIRRRLKLGNPGAPPPVQEDEGLTVEERREILASIDKVTSREGLTTGTGSTAIKPLRKGFVFPLVVNLLALVLTAGIVATLAFVFRQQDRSLAAGNAVVSTAEGQLIQVIKRDAESKLLEKDKAIAEIQNRLSGIDRQRSELAATIEQRITAREAELRAALKVELDKERQRLTELGYSEAVIQAKLKVFEAQKTAEFNSQLAAFQRQAAAEKAAEDAKLAQARDEYQRNIAGLNDERRKLLDESKKREEELRASLETKTRELEGQSAAAKASASQAQALANQAKAELGRLEDQKSRVQAVEDRIIGLYSSIRASLRERRFADALASVSALNSFLSEPSVVSIPAIQARREADLFVTEALGSLAQGEIEKASVDSSKLVRQAELMAAVREASAAGDRALKAGDLSTAAAKYQESLSAVPEILAAHEYFLGKARLEDAARRTRLDSSLAAADTAFKSGDLGAAAARYGEALAWLPMDEGSRAVMLGRLAQAGALEADRSRRALDSKSARVALSQARQQLGAGDWPAAMSGFIGLLASYPAADQAGEALKGIESARAGMDRDYQARAAAYEKAIAALKADAGQTAVKLAEDNRTLSASLDASNQARAEAAAKLSESAARLADAEARLSDSESRLKLSQDQLAALQGQSAATLESAGKGRASAEAKLSDSEAKLADSEAKLAAAEAKLAASEATLSDVQAKLSDSGAKLKSSQDKIAALQGQLTAAQAATAKAAVQAGSVSPQDAAAATGDAKALARLRAQVDALKGEYDSYVAAESASAGKSGDAALIERQKRLVALFGSGEFKTVFPELERLVDAQMAAWQQQMSLATLRAAADIAIQATRAKPGKERESALDSSARHYAGDPTVLGFIDALRGLLK